MTSRLGGTLPPAERSVEASAQDQQSTRAHTSKSRRRSERVAQKALETTATATSSNRKRKEADGSKAKQEDHKRYASEHERQEQLRKAAEERSEAVAPILSQAHLTERRRAQLITRINEDGDSLAALNLSKEDIFAIAPSLTHVSLHDLFDASWSQDEQERLVGLCTAATILHIGPSSIRTLPSTLACQELVLNDCENLGELPTLGHLERLSVGNCSRLSKICTQPSLTIVQVAHCEVLNEVEGLPRCETIKLKHLAQLVTLPEAFPECKDFECVASPILPSLPALVKCESLRCNGCTALTTLGVSLPALTALSCKNCSALTREGIPGDFARFRVFLHSGTPALADEPERRPQVPQMPAFLQLMFLSALLESGFGLLVPGGSPSSN